jgi:esterase/lipase
MSGLCKRVVVGGVAVGGSLALDLAARVTDVAGVFAVCSPVALRNYSTNFMPAGDVWNRLLNKMRLGERNGQFLDFSHGNSHVNYRKNPVAGIWEVGELLESIEKSYGAIRQPALIVQADKDPVVDPKCGVQLFNAIGSAKKELCLLSYDRHILVNGDGSEKVFRKIKTFIGSL